MRLDTVVYLEKDEKILMLFRNKKKNDINWGKYIGVGGKIEENESPYECAIREVLEETGLKVKSLSFRGHITFLYNTGIHYIYVFSSLDFEGEIIDCNEGSLEWVDKKELLNLNIWETDKIFLKKIVDNDYTPFMIKAIYKNNKLIKEVVEI